jgi:hypothetical protein
VGLKHFTTDVCPLLEGNKCSVESAKFISCRTYPFQGDDVQKHGSIDIIPCPLGLEIIYDFVGMLLYGKHTTFGSLKNAPLWKDDLQTILNCYNERVTSDCEDPVKRVGWNFSTHISALQGYAEVSAKAWAIMHSMGRVIKQTIESCAGMQEVDEKVIEDLIEKVGRVINEDEATKQVKKSMDVVDSDYCFTRFNEKGAYNFMYKEMLRDIEGVLKKTKPVHSTFDQTILSSAVLRTAQVLKLDPAMDDMIAFTDLSELGLTQANTKFDFSAPYPLMFIDKVFRSGKNKYILGVFVYDIVHLEHLLKDNKNPVHFDKYKIKIDEEDNLCRYNSNIGFPIPIIMEEGHKFSDKKQKIIINFIVAEVDETKHVRYYFITSSVANILNIIHNNPLKENRVLPTEGCVPLEETDSTQILQDVLKYVSNIFYLIENHVNPANPKHSDYRRIPYYLDDTSRRAVKSRFSTLKVFGISRQECEEFSNSEEVKVRKQRGDYHLRESIVITVREHWRQFKSERFTNMRGKRKKIKSYQKGKGELLPHIVKVKMAKLGKVDEIDTKIDLM